MGIKLVRPKLDKRLNYNGFTLVEILVVVGIMLFAFAFIFPLTLSQIQDNKLNSSAQEVAGAIFEAQQYAYNRKDNLGYGISFQSGGYQFLSGMTYDTATPDDQFKLETGVTNNQSLFGSSPDIFFDPGSLRPNQPGQVVISDGSNTVVVIVNSEGAIFIND